MPVVLFVHYLPFWEEQTVIRRVARYKKNRRQISKSQPARPSYTVPTLTTLTSPALTVSFDQPITVSTGSGAVLPGWLDTTTTPHRTVISVSVIDSTTITLTFSGTVTAADAIVVPQNDPAIRTAQGGFVQPGSYAAP